MIPLYPIHKTVGVRFSGTTKIPAPVQIDREFKPHGSGDDTGGSAAGFCRICWAPGVGHAHTADAYR